MKMKEMKLLLRQLFNKTLCSKMYLVGHPRSYV